MNNICRVCESTKIYTNLIENSNKIILKKLKACADIQFDPKDSLPKYICKHCILNLEFAYKFKIQCEYTDQKLRDLLEAGDYGGRPEIQNNIYFVNLEKEKFISNVNLENVSNINEQAEKEQENVEEDQENIEEDQESVEEDHENVEEEEEEEEEDQNQEKDIQKESKRTDLIEINGVTFEEYSSYSAEEYNDNEEAEAEEVLNEDQPNDDPKYIEIDFDENQMLEVNSAKLEVLDDISEEPINNPSEFEEHIIENQSDCADGGDDEICNQSQDTIEHSSVSIQNDTLAISQIKIENEELNDKTIAKNKHFICDTCNEIFYFYDKFNEHKKSHGNQRYQCPDCGKWFSKRYNMKNHQVTHQNEKKFPCNLCTRRYTNQGNLDRHIRVFHNQEKKYFCGKCGKGFSQSSILKQHESVHIDDKQFECDVCHKWFKSNIYLNLHKNRHLPTFHLQQRKKKKSYFAKMKKPMKKTCICPVCGKKSNSLYLHESHMRTHTGEKPYECTECKKRFSFQQSLRNHILCHTGERPFECNVCHLTFRQIGHLQGHKLIHSGVKQHKCLVCMKSFALRGNLNVHMRLHTGETPYHCTYCPKKFYDSNGLKRHKLIHTKKPTEKNDPVDASPSISVTNERNELTTTSIENNSNNIQYAIILQSNDYVNSNQIYEF